MADFRKWLLAFAVVALLLGVGVPASAQTIGNAPGFSCTANASNPTIVRAEGVAELVGDVVLNCNGGNSAAAGTPIQLSNIQVSLNTNITSRIVASSTNLSEALMLIDEPFPASGAVGVGQGATQIPGAANVQLACQAINSTNCAINGTGGGFGAAGPYNGTAGHFNIFQGFMPNPSAQPGTVAWNGVPIDAPGTVNTRIIRFTNIRANACLLGVSSTLIPTQIVLFIQITGSQNLTVANPQVTVAFIQQGLRASNGNSNFLQCQNLNGNLLGNSVTGQTGTINVTATEGFASAFKVRSYAQVLSPGSSSSTTSLQNIPGFNYNTESGFVSAATGPVVGLADAGTMIQFSFAGVGTGVSVFVPNTVPLQQVNSSPTVFTGGTAILVGSGGGSGTTQVTVSGGVSSVIYEIVGANPNVLEQIVVPIQAAFISNTSTNTPPPTVAPAGPGTVSVNFAPLASSTQQIASTSAPIPRFCQPNPANPIFNINVCTCNLLFPFVTNQAGFDTGIAIANTSADTFGTPTQTGAIKLTYFGGVQPGNAPAPPAQTTTGNVPAGCELTFVLSGGGGVSNCATLGTGTSTVTATPGFQGYIIASANFQFCHGFAFISDLGAQRLAEGYLALEMDSALPSRTRVSSEVLGH